MSHRNATFNNIDFSLEELLDIKKALNQSIIIAVTDQRGIIQSVNDHFCTISKYERHELIGLDHRILNSGVHSKAFFKQMWRTIGAGRVWQGDICNRAKDGSLYWVKTTIVPFFNEAGKPNRYIALRTDITAEKMVSHMTHIAYHDDLTGLPNRRSLMEQLQEEIDIATENQSKFALLFLDVNRFKNINDSLGHKVGDLFLKELANRLRTIDKTHQSVFRLNGDEFIYIIRDVQKIEQSVEAIFDVMRQSFMFYEYEFYITTSIGISIFPDHGLKVSQLLRLADAAMYKAKVYRGNSCVVYDKAFENSNDQLLTLETKLHKALKQNSFELYYQPKYALASQKIVGVEALIRWHDEKNGIIPPSEFIPFAEECGMISLIGDWVIREAAKQAKYWHEQVGCSIRVAINISPSHLAEKQFVNRLCRILAEEQVQPCYLEIEITEMAIMDHTEELLHKMKQLREMGITFAMDDFGTGYSSLSYLREFPLDTLKIDRSFVQNSQQDPSGSAMMEAIIKLAKAMDLDVVAEGVETIAELELLQQFNCDYVQGYYFSQPVTAEELTKLLVAHT